MRTKYQNGEDVPIDVLCKRLDVLSDAVTKGRSSIERNFGMSVPARHEHDADLVLSEAAIRLKRLETMLDCQHENVRNVCIEIVEQSHGDYGMGSADKQDIIDQIRSLPRDIT